MSWAQRLKRVFRIEIETCAQCGAKLKVIANIEGPAVIGKFLGRLAGCWPAVHKFRGRVKFRGAGRLSCQRRIGPTAVAARIPGWHTQLMRCLKCLFPRATST